MSPFFFFSFCRESSLPDPKDTRKVSWFEGFSRSSDPKMTFGTRNTDGPTTRVVTFPHTIVGHHCSEVIRVLYCRVFLRVDGSPTSLKVNRGRNTPYLSTVSTFTFSVGTPPFRKKGKFKDLKRSRHLQVWCLGSFEFSLRCFPRCLVFSGEVTCRGRQDESNVWSQKTYLSSWSRRNMFQLCNITPHTC